MDTCNLEKLSMMFYECESLILFPDLKKWNFEKLNEKDLKFFNSETDSLLLSMSKERESNSSILNDKASNNNQSRENN